MADVSLSYARPSAKAATLIAEALRVCGYSVWFDESPPAHRAYSELIEEQLESAAAVLVLWSAGAVRSQWVLAPTLSPPAPWRRRLLARHSRWRC
jgi:adenylate cyclase